MPTSDTDANEQTSTGPAPRAREPARTAFLVFDCESVPDGELLSAVKYAGENLSPEHAVERARAEARESARDGSDFLPVSFQVPVAVCVARVGPSFELLDFSSLDAPRYRPREIVGRFWAGVARYRAKLVTFNGRGFDLPLMELAAFRYGIPIREYVMNSRNRFNGGLDLLDWMTNYGASRLAGGLDLLAKMIGAPGKQGVAGDQVLDLHRAGRLKEIAEYCTCDVLDTYFVFLRTRVLTGDISQDREAELVARAKELIRARAAEVPALREYLANWTAGTA